MKRTTLALKLVTLLLVINIVAISIVHFEPKIRVYAQSVGNADDWVMFRHDAQHSGYSMSTAPDTNEIKWFYNTSVEIDSSPAVANGRVIVGASNGNVLALNSTTGEKLWMYETGAGSNSIWSSPAIDSGRVYIGARDFNLYCLNETNGALLWKYLTGGEVDSSPLVANGRVYFGSFDGNLYCLNSNDGSRIWKFTTEGDDFGNVGSIYSSPAIMDNVVFFGSYDSRLYAVDASTGLKIWSYPSELGIGNYTTDQGIDSSPTVSDGKVFFTSSMGKVHCLNADNGALIWNTPDVIYFVRSSPAVDGGRVFIGDANNKFYCFDASTGVLIWNFTNIGAVWSSPAVADGKVFFGTEEGKVYCLDENTGSQIWSYRALERVASSPAISDGTVFVGCGNAMLGVGGVYAFGAKYSLPTSLSLFLNSETSLLGFKVTLNGVLEGDDKPIEGASILLSYSVTGGETWNDITAVPTSTNGSYFAVWQPSATGTYLVRAKWASHYPYEPAESTRMLSVNTFDEQNVFSVVSNSTVSALAFNSTSKELSFSVSGPNGTVGFVDITIAKTLITNIADLSVYLDGTSLNYETTSTADSWQLHFTYTHSTHDVVVNLGKTVISDGSEPEPFPTALVVAAASVGAVAVVGAALLFYFKKRQH